MKFISKWDPKDRFSQIFSTTKVVHVASCMHQIDEVNEFFLELAKQVGVVIICDEDPLTGELIVNQWNKIKYDPNLFENAYKYSNKYQPLHTDYGYFSLDVFCSFFYCVEQAQFGGATTFIDVDKVVSILQSMNSTLFTEIQNRKIHFGRSESPLTNNIDFILQKDELGWKINWNYYRALGDEKNKALVEDFKGFLDNYIEKSGELTEIKLNPGEGVFFHDRRVLHGRNSFLGDRHLNKGAIAQYVPIEVSNFLISK